MTNHEGTRQYCLDSLKDLGPVRCGTGARAGWVAKRILVAKMMTVLF